VDIGKLKRVLFKEFTKSPLKTGFLVAMCPVALYFIVPLCLPERAKAKRPEAEQVQDLSYVAAHENSGQTVAATPSNWNELAERMRNDGRMASADLGTFARNPFQLAGNSLDEESAEESETIEDMEEEDLGAAHGIVLTATIVSPRLQLATINGRMYGIQDDIVLSEDTLEGTSRKESFRLKEVGTRHAILARDGREILLELPNNQRQSQTSITIKRTK